MKSIFLKNKFNLLWLIIAVFATAIIFPNYFEANIYPLPKENDFWISLDQSWLIALNYFNLKHLNWGQDIIFTYGPLSYLSTRVGWGHNRIDFLIYDLFLAINFFLMFFLSLKDSKNKTITILLIFTIIFLYPLWVGSSNAIILMAFLIFWIRQSIESPKVIYFIFQIIILTLVFFIKFNTGLIAFPLFYAGILYSIIKHKNNRLFLIIFMFLPLALIFVLSTILNVSLLEYIKNGFQIISGYNDIMYLGHNDLNKSFAILIIVLTISVLLYRTYREKKTELLKNLVVIFLFGTSIFVLYKQGFVRGMEVDFFIFSPLFIFSIKDFQELIISKKNITIIVSICLLTSIYFNYSIQNSMPNVKEKLNKIYIEGYKNFTPNSGIHFSSNENQFPDYIKQKIGNNTIDVYPWNIQILLENKLNYSPRPVCQSYSAYTPILEERNFDLYNSEKAPKYVLYNYAAIDDRYPLFDESKLNLLLTKNYKIVDTLRINNNFTLLLEKKQNKKISFIQTREYAMYIDSPLIPKEGVFYKVFVYRNLLGDFIGAINYSPEITLSVKTKDGNIKDYKTSKGLLETGLFGTQHITTTNDFMDLLTSTNKNQREISAYYFKPNHSRYFKEKIRIIEYKIQQ